MEDFIIGAMITIAVILAIKSIGKSRKRGTGCMGCSAHCCGSCGKDQDLSCREDCGDRDR